MAAVPVELLTDGRLIEVGASGCGGTVTTTPSVDFAFFDEITSGSPGLGGSAQQTSQVSPELITGSGSASSSEECGPRSRSELVIDFRVTAPVAYELSGVVTCSLDSYADMKLTRGAATIHIESPFGGQVAFDYSGVLEPGDYRIAASAGTFDLASASYDVSLSLTEPAVSVPLLSPLAAGLLATGLLTAGLRRARS